MSALSSPQDQELGTCGVVCVVAGGHVCPVQPNFRHNYEADEDCAPQGPYSQRPTEKRNQFPVLRVHQLKKCAIFNKSFLLQMVFYLSVGLLNHFYVTT